MTSLRTRRRQRYAIRERPRRRDQADAPSRHRPFPPRPSRPQISYCFCVSYAATKDSRSGVAQALFLFEDHDFVLFGFGGHKPGIDEQDFIR